MEALVTLCEECHAEENEIRPIYEKELLLALREIFLAEDVKEIALGFKQLPMLFLPEVVASIYKWALTDEKIQKELMDRFFEHIKKDKNLE